MQDLPCKLPNNFLQIIRKKLEENDRNFLLVRHWFYKCASAPAIHIFSDLEDFFAFLPDIYAGDIVQVWCLSDDTCLVQGKAPDVQGLVPTRGAY